MADFYKNDGSECTRESRGLKLRIADVYRKGDQTAAEMMAEMRLLTDADLQDFRQWFTDAGYPVTA